MGYNGVGNVLQAIEKLKSDTIRERTEGLEGVKSFFDQDLNNLDGLGDDELHELFEHLFKLVWTEKKSYLRASKATTKNTVSSRLGTAASALRTIVEVVNAKLEEKTVAALLDHIVDILSVTESVFLEPVATDYLKCFKIILQHRSHAEHLRPKFWLSYIDFLLDAINRSLIDNSDDANSTQSLQTSGTTRGVHGMAIRGSQLSVSHGQRSLSNSRIEHTLEILCLLTAAANAPISARLTEIVQTLTVYINSSSQALVPAFESLNNLLPIALTEDVAVTSRVFKDICSPMQRLWSTKSVALKDEMLTTLYYLRHVYLNPSTTYDENDAFLLDLLIGVLWSENEKKLDKDLLQLDALDFAQYEDVSPLSIRGISRATDQHGGQTSWSTIYVLSLLIVGLNRMRHISGRLKDEDHSTKRRRTENSYDDVYWRMENATGVPRIVAIQVALFLTENFRESDFSLADNVSRFELLINEDDSSVSSWTMILLGRISLYESSKPTVLHDFWRRIWSAAAGAIKISSSSRYACYLMQKMIEAGIVMACLTPQAISESIFPDGNSGPAQLTDTAITLLVTALTHGLFDNERTFRHFASRSLGWLEARWIIPIVPDRMHNAQSATYGQPVPLIELLNAIAGREVLFRPPKARVFVGPIDKAASIDCRDLAFTRFLTSEDTKSYSVQPKVSLEKSDIHTLPPHAYLGADAMAEFMILKLKSFRTAWLTLASERVADINIDIASIAATACTLSSFISSWSKPLRIGLESPTLELWNMICDSCSRRGLETFYELATNISWRLLQPRTANALTNYDISTARSPLVLAISAVMKHGPDSQNVAMLDYELMDSYGPALSQTGNTRQTMLNATGSRLDLPQPLDVGQQFLVNRLHLELDILIANTTGILDADSTAKLFEELRKLEAANLFAARSFIQHVLRTEVSCRRSDVSKLVGKIGGICLEQGEELDRCELALCLCINVLTKFTDLWAGTEEDELSDVAFEVYQWFLKVSAGKNIASERVLKQMTILLEKLLKVNPSYAHGDLPSPRTVLLQILQKGSSGLKFQMAPQLSKLFEGYVLSEHTAIFDDIVENLPSDPDDKAGIEARLYILAYLGARWHTVLREAIYHIFDTAANVPIVASFAKKCVHMMCTFLSTDNAKSLFRLFSSQIFYTWLEKKEKISMIPAEAFGYDDLEALLQDNKAELAAQVTMRASSAIAEDVTQHFTCDWNDLLESSFARVIAYAIIADISYHRTSRHVGPAEEFILETLKEERYSILLQRHFAEALSIILQRLGDDKGFEKSVEGRKDRGGMAITYNEMQKLSSSDTQLPPGQQPSFRAKYLLPILKRLSSRVGVQDDQLWSSPVLIYTLRSLLDDTNPALGPLHACATIRKLRVVISMSGPSALERYPLEMLLHGVRPFMTSFHCSADALGIIWYLLQHGKSYLQTRPQFVAGICVTMFTSLLDFVNSSQDSTTQESHFQTTILHAHDFRKWLGDYLGEFPTEKMSSQRSAAFLNIIDSAKRLKATGCNNRNTAEGSLLYYLIMDQASQDPLLTKAFLHYTLQILCKDFDIAADPADDILTSEDDLVKAIPILWQTIRQSDTKGNFLLWLGQSLGRASLLLGPETISLRAGQSAHATARAALSLNAIDSYSQVISHLMDHLWGSNKEYASAAEHTLQAIFSSIHVSKKGTYLDTAESEDLFQQLRFDDMACPDPSGVDHQTRYNHARNSIADHTWATAIAKHICQQYTQDPVLCHLGDVISFIDSLSSLILPMVVHLALSTNTTEQINVRDYLASTFAKVMNTEDHFSKQHATLALRVIIYLRRCSLPSELTMGQRNSWIPIDFKLASVAALKCGNYHDSLLMLEIHASQHALTVGRTSKRTSTGESVVPRELMADIFHNIDDPDFFYGTVQDASFHSIFGKLCHEGDGNKALSFQSALLDAGVRTLGLDDAAKANRTATVSALNMANYRALAKIIGQNSNLDTARIEAVTHDTLNLGQWTVADENTSFSDAHTVSSFFHVLGSATHTQTMLSSAKAGIQVIADRFQTYMHRPIVLSSLCTSLAILAEITQALSNGNPEDMCELLARGLHGKSWVESERFTNIEPLLLAREAFVSTIRTNVSLQAQLKMNSRSALLLEIRILRSSLSIGRFHDMLQFSLDRAAYMSDLVQPAIEMGVKADVAIRYDIANTFWSQNENSASIKLLQSLHPRKDLKDQVIPISKSEILTDLGQKLTQARLDRADEITSQYLRPAIAALEKSVDGSTAGRVYHNFAVFCDQQLRDAENLDEYQRVERLRNRKKQEVLELERIKKGKEGKERDLVRGHLAKAQTWFKLDEQEWRRLRAHREGLVSNCLENYLKSMRSCDNFPNDVLRFLALWLEQSKNSDANATVEKYLRLVQSYKFAPLMNQLSSRLLNEEDTFQKILFGLMFRICNDHPYHSLYQVFATSKSKGQKNDTVATSRHQAATKLSAAVMHDGSAKALWVSIHNTCIACVRAAQERASDHNLKSGSKTQLRKTAMGAKLEQAALESHQKIPPPTMDIALRPNGDYALVPKLVRLDPYVTIAGGVSAPKIVTAIASDGSLHKMLLKGGNDDLRQDSIMEQVFKQVSDLLKDNRDTRQRNLGIRTYKVIPLMHNAGIIEFVKNTIPLHDYILPAHGRYYPKDLTPNRCRKTISDASTKPLAQRLQAYSNVTSNFHPVMRFFFMEHFLDPDDWFQKRLNYSRSTAAISMLGHVLGIGDRHGHNILLDTKTGEVVHIDLGVAFEAGRVLPVPEVVPFRLTRDIVDGMGISGVEGVFRRCCIFTLEALRKDQEAIMTILDVLRYDPLYSWSISPIRLQRMQENQEQAAIAAASASMVSSSIDVRSTPGIPSSGEQTAAEAIPTKQSEVNEPGEADRALAVVARKLGKSLSVEATVNDLIRQAMDERNLAVLYCGWAAYA